MPIFEYVCAACSHRFEAFIQGAQQASCPACHGAELEKQLSVFAVGGGSSTASAAVGPMPCGTCGDPRGAGSCSLN